MIMRENDSNSTTAPSQIDLNQKEINDYHPHQVFFGKWSKIFFSYKFGKNYGQFPFLFFFWMSLLKNKHKVLLAIQKNGYHMGVF